MAGYVDTLLEEAFKLKVDTPKKRHQPMTSLHKKPEDPSVYFKNYQTRYPGQYKEPTKE